MQLHQALLRRARTEEFSPALFRLKAVSVYLGHLVLVNCAIQDRDMSLIASFPFLRYCTAPPPLSPYFSNLGDRHLDISFNKVTAAGVKIFSRKSILPASTKNTTLQVCGSWKYNIVSINAILWNSFLGSKGSI